VIADRLETARRLSKATTQQEQQQELEAALLAIRVLDPACGSGHFLLAAARRLALELARIRAGDEEPSEELRQECLREVVAHCIYGVDKNPMAVELCKVALWIEAVDPGKPLSFLDAHIQCGDSLVGVFDPKVLEQGIPDEAYKPLTGDDKPTCTSLKKENASFRKAGQKGTLQGTLNLQGSPPISRSQQRLQEIETMPETTLVEGAAKQAAYEAWEQERSSDPQTLAADLYTAAFFLPKIKDSRSKVPTSEHLLLLQSGQEIPGELELAVEQAARDFRFFHWHLRFGEVMGRGGFDCVLGNPPWDMLQLDPQEFFALRLSSISTAKHMAARNRMIAALEDENPELFTEYMLQRRGVDGTQRFVHDSGRFPLASFGRINLAPLFSELTLKLIHDCGRAGLIVPTGIVTDSFTQYFCRHILESQKLVSLYDFRTGPGLFADIGHQRFKFSLITLGSAESADFTFFSLRASDIVDSRRHFTLTKSDFELLNPNTRTCPVFRSQMDAELTKKIFRNSSVLLDDDKGNQGNPWQIRFNLMFMMNTDSHLFLDEPLADALPLYEAKMIHHFDHRWAEYDLEGSVNGLSDATKCDFSYEPRPRYWVERAEVDRRLAAQNWKHKWLIGWRDICRNTDYRTLIAGVIPISAVGDKFQLLLIGLKPSLAAALLGCISSIPCDYIARQKVGGTSLKQFSLKQIAMVPPSSFGDASLEFILSRVIELTYTSNALKSWAEDLGYDGPPFRFDPERRALLRAELDAFYAHLYGLSRDELRYILDPADVMGPDYPSETFRVLKNNEFRQFGEYRTQRLVLEAWDRLFG
jgi:hypothetical protein